MGQKYALIIGNNEYDDASLARLLTPAADVEGLATVLKAADIGGFDEVVSLVNESSIRVRREIARFYRDKRRDDLLLLYFSGHGVLDDHGKLYLAVKDTERDLLKGTAIEASFITDVMDGSYSRQQVLILDCCHSGAFARGAKGATGATVGTAQTFEGTASGRVVLTATDATQYAWEGDRVIGQADNSVFTHFLIQGLQTGEADANADGRVTLDELYDYAHTQVVKATPKQNPRKWSFNQEGEIVVAKNPHTPVPKLVELPIELKLAIESPLANVREGAVRELDRLLNGSNARLSLAAFEALKQLAEDDSRRVASTASIILNAYLKSDQLIQQTAEVEKLTTRTAGGEQSVQERAAVFAAITPRPGRSSTIGRIIGGLIIVGLLVALLVIGNNASDNKKAGDVSATQTAAAIVPLTTETPRPTSTMTPIPATATNTRIPSVTSTHTPLPTYSSTPTKTPSPIRIPTKTTAPLPISPPGLLVPAGGSTVTNNNLDFQWQSPALPDGYAFRVRLQHPDTQYVIASPLLKAQHWTATLPGEKVGWWSWTVSIVKDSAPHTTGTTSGESGFWFNPFQKCTDCGGGSKATWTPAP
jgi:hypothetical protein